MNRTLFTGFMAFLLAVPGAQLVRARGQMTMGQFDPKTEVTLSGTVEKIGRPDGSNMMMGMGLHLTLKTGNETTEVHLGPASFVEKTMTLKEGDVIEVTGAKVTMMGTPFVMAREVRKGDQILKLRDEQGRPLWRGSHGHMGRMS